MKTTIWLASSASPFIFSAMVNEETAVGAPNISINPTSSISLKPKKALKGSIMLGNINSLPITLIIVCFRFALIALNSKEAPKRISDKGVAILDISSTDFSKTPGSFTFKNKKSTRFDAAII